MTDDPFWSCLEAVKRGTCYEPPGLLYSWFDRPPSINRLIGVIWLSGVLYPQQFNWDMADEVRCYYRLFYRMELTSEEIDSLLANPLVVKHKNRLDAKAAVMGSSSASFVNHRCLSHHLSFSVDYVYD